MVRKALILLAALAIGLTIAACGGDDDESGETNEASEAPAATATGPGGTVKISETEFALTPANPTVKNGDVTFQVTNDGQANHNLAIEGNGVEEELDADLAPGESGTLTVNLPPGTYEMYCPVDGHKDQGMTGELTVQ